MTNTNPSTLPPSVDDSGSVGVKSHRSATPSVEILSVRKLPWPGIDVTITFARIHPEKPA